MDVVHRARASVRNAARADGGSRPIWGLRRESPASWRHFRSAPLYKHYTGTSGMKTEIDYLKRFELSAGVLAVILAIYNLLLIASRIFVNRIYTNAMPQDFMAFLDCIYRVHLGQIVHRDFSSVLGPFNFCFTCVFYVVQARNN